MTINARKWQSKCNEMQKAIDEETFMREEFQSKCLMSEKKVLDFSLNIIKKNLHLILDTTA